MVKFENNENENDNEKTDNVVEDPDPYFVPIVSLPEVEVSKLLEFKFLFYLLHFCTKHFRSLGLKSLVKAFDVHVLEKGFFF